MPRQNRVTPLSTIIATPARGRWLGNRGCIHDETGRIRSLYQTRRWIFCLLQFKGVRRKLMQPGRWTELFFLDEATALAAGHRPCAYCQRPRYEEFRAVWSEANPDLSRGVKPSAEALDAVLHAERLDSKRTRVTYEAPFGTLPDGTFILLETKPYLVSAGRAWQWQPHGYTGEKDMPAEAPVTVLTPRSVVQTLAAGFSVQIDESATA